MNKPQQDPQIPTVAIALIVAFILGSGFFALIVVVIPGAAMMLLVGFLMIALFVAQYFIWGRPLYRYVVNVEQQRIAAEEARAAEMPDGE